MSLPPATHLFAVAPDVLASSNDGTLVTTLCGEKVELLADRALHWPRERTLFVADVHLGKAATFRAGGVAVPRGTTAGDLERLSRLVERTRAASLVVLGDFFHAAAGRVDALDLAFRGWRSAHRSLRVIVVRGNHDVRAGDPSPAWDVEVVDEPHPLPPFLACHRPQSPPTGFALCGHVHPGAWIHGRGRESVRLPCFVLGPRHALLPAFGRLTGLHVVEAARDERIVVVAGGRLFGLPPG